MDVSWHFTVTSVCGHFVVFYYDIFHQYYNTYHVIGSLVSNHAFPIVAFLLKDCSIIDINISIHNLKQKLSALYTQDTCVYTGHLHIHRTPVYTQDTCVYTRHLCIYIIIVFMITCSHTLGVKTDKSCKVVNCLFYK